MRTTPVARLVFAITVAVVAVDQKTIAQDDLQPGQLAIDSGNFDGAIDFFSFKLSADPKNSAAHAGRGMAYLRKGDVKNALTDFNEAIRLDPKFSRGYADRARLNLALHENDKALTDASKAVQLSPTSSDAY